MLRKEVCRQVTSWTNGMVVDWISSIPSIAHLTEIFKENGICGQDLLDLSHDDLQSLGLHRLTERKAVFRALRDKLGNSLNA